MLEIADRELVTVTAARVEVAGRPGAAAHAVLASADHRAPDKGGFDTYMRKEIFEQPAASPRPSSSTSSTATAPS